jgi:hypothetical protein
VVGHIKQIFVAKIQQRNTSFFTTQWGKITTMKRKVLYLNFLRGIFLH